MKRTLFDQDHESFRHLARQFFLRECTPYTQKWEEQGHVDRDVWIKAGSAGLLMWSAPPSSGGLGIKDFRYNAVLTEEFYQCGVAGFGIGIQNDIIAPYLLNLATPQQQSRWLPGSVSGEFIWAIAMSEPEAGSDLQAMKTTATCNNGTYVVNGSKTFITNGLLANRVIAAVKTDATAGKRGITLIVIEEGMAGFSRGRKLDKVGQRSQDTAELFFDDVVVPDANVLGTVNGGFYHLMEHLPQERLGIAVAGVAVMERALHLTKAYVRSRRIFGQTLGSFQNTRFELADLHTLAHVCRVYVDHAVSAHCAGELSAVEAAGVKQWVTDRQCELVDRCVQLFGGYGYMNDFEIARLWRDSRVQRIYGGSNEVMKEVVGRSLHLEA